MVKDPNTRPNPPSAHPAERCDDRQEDERDAGQLSGQLSGQFPGHLLGQSPATPSVAADARPIARLVPHSGIQLIDLTLPVANIAQTHRSFAEHRYASGGSFRTVLMPLERAGSGDVVWHPVSHRALSPDEIMSVSGQAALETFAGRWLPLPYLRFLGRDDAGLPSFDSGPENWARVFIAPLSAPVPDAGGAMTDESDPVYRLVLAFDTRLQVADRTGDRLYLAPNTDDAALGASFKLAAGAGDLARFASRPWVDGWMRQAFAGDRARASGGAPQSPFELEHIARYLVLVELLGHACAMPEIRFLDTLSRRWPVPVTGVDLLLDVSAADTAAVLVDRDVADGGSSLMAAAAPIVLRDLAHPVTHYAGPIPTQVEFAPAPFGDAGLSRRSGRPDAFLWPSLGRIGREAAALALGATATAGVTGQSALPSLIGETALADDIWRMGVEGAGASIGPVVSGALLAHLAEDGTPLSANGDRRPPAIRPRFAPSALMTFFMAELLLHALASVNAAVAATDASRAPGARRLQRIVLTLPAGMAADVRAGHATHVTEAIDLIWRVLGWDAVRDAGAPQRPDVVIGAGTELAAQVFELRREIATRYGNDPAALSSASGAARDGDAAIVPASARGPHVFRVASIELGGESASAIVTDYAATGDGMVTPLQAVSEQWDDGEQGLLSVLAEEFILRAVSAALAEHGHPAPGMFLSRVLDTTTIRDSGERNLARRLRSKVVRPAASALLRIACELPPRVAGGQRIQSLRGLVTRGGGRFEPYAADFDGLAQRDGAAAFKLDLVEIRFSQRQLDHAIRAASGRAIRRAVDLVSRQGCDLVLVSGELAALPAVADALVAALPLEPGRLVFPARQAASGDSPGLRSSVAAALAPHRVAGIAGAYLAGRAAPGFEAFDRVVRAIGRDLATPMLAPALAAPPPGGLDAVPRTFASGSGTVVTLAVELATGREP